MRRALRALALGVLAGCQSGPQLTGAEWELVELGGRPAPRAAGERPATLRFQPDRVGGFAGCNRFGGSYALDGDKLQLGPLMLTKMACAEGMELERRFVRALESAVRYQVVGGNLVLYDVLGPAASFSRRK